jgi:hypothetical protein
VRGKGRGSTRGSWATCRWSREGSGWPESSCPRRAGPAAGGARRRGDSGERRREGPGREAAVGHREAYSAVNLRRKRAEGRAPRRTEAHGGAMGRWRGLFARGEDLRCHFIDKRIDGEPLVS